MVGLALLDYIRTNRTYLIESDKQLINTIIKRFSEKRY